MRRVGIADGVRGFEGRCYVKCGTVASPGNDLKRGREALAPCLGLAANEPGD